MKSQDFRIPTIKGVFYVCPKEIKNDWKEKKLEADEVKWYVSTPGP